MKKNKICLIFHMHGQLHPFFNLFLYSLAQNKNIDFLFINDIKNKPELPSNVIDKFLTAEDLNPMLTATLKDWFDLDIPDPLLLNVREKETVFKAKTPMYKFADYRCYFDDIFKKDLEGYEYCGYFDNDTIMGDIENIIQPLMDKNYNFIGSRGHFCLYKNDGFIKQILTNIGVWPENGHKNYLNLSLNKHKDELINKNHKHLLTCEGWSQGTVKVYSTLIPTYKFYKLTENGEMCDLFNPAENASYKDVFIPRHFEENNIKNYTNQYFSYQKGKLFRIQDERGIKTEHLYLHLIGRTKLMINNINITSYNEGLSFNIKPNYFELI